jgi:hypothetical protein
MGESTMSEILITGPGRYPTEQGVATIEPLSEGDDYVHGYRWIDKSAGRTYMPDGRFDVNGHITGNTSGDIIGPRIEDAPILGDTQRTSREAKPSPMERLDAYAKRWNVTLRTEPWGGHGWRVNLTRWIPEQDESVRAEYYGFGDTMSAAIDDVMDAVEGVS